MSNNTPEALRLARMIEHYNAGVGSQRIVEDYQQAAGELRRLYFENEKLRAALAEQPAEQDRHQTFIDTLPDHLDDKMFEQIDLWARQTYKRHQSQVRGQMFDSRDSHQTHLIYAAFRWAKEHGNPLGDATDAPQPRRRLTDEEIDNTTRKQVDDLLDHIYEYGTAAEGIDYRVRAIARAIERAHGIGEHE